MFGAGVTKSILRRITEKRFKVWTLDKKSTGKSKTGSTLVHAGED